MDPSSIAGQIASHGVLGLMLVIVLYGYWKKDQELTDERAARVSDAKSFNDMALKLQSQVIDAVNKCTDILNEVKRMVPQQPPKFGGGR